MTDLNLKHPSQVEAGDVVQILHSAVKFKGHLAVITERHSWGVEADIWDTEGLIPIRLELGDFLHVGRVSHPGPFDEG